MAQSLTGKTIADTYKFLLRVNADDSTLAAYNSAPYSLATGAGDPYPIFFNQERVLIGAIAAVPNASLDVRQGGSSDGDIECVKLRIKEAGTIGTTSDVDLLQLSTGLLKVNGEITTTSNVNVGGNLVVTGESTFNGVINLGDTVADTLNLTALIESNLIPTGSRNLGSDANQWNDLYITGTANIDSLVADTVAISAGSINSTTVGTSGAAAAEFTSCTIATADINGGAIDGAAIGVNAQSTGKFNSFESSDSSNTFIAGSISGSAIGGGAISAITSIATTTGGGITASGDGTVTAGKLVVDTNTLTANLVDDKVGIGTASPDHALEVSSANDQLALNATTGDVTLQFKEAGVEKAYIQWDSGNDFLRINDGTGSMNMKGGNVGIGVASPTDEKLEIGGAIVVGDAEASAGATADGAIKYASGDFMGRKAGSWVTLTAVPGTSSAAGWSLHGSNYVYLTTGGDQVSIGGGAPTDGAVKLDVDGTIRGEGWHVNTQMDFTSGDNGSGLHGLVPAPTQANYDDGKFLKADGTWADPGAGTIGAVGDVTISSATDGDMLVWSGSAWVDLTPSITTAGTASYVSGNAAATLSYAAASATYTITPMAMPTKANLDIDNLESLVGAVSGADNLGTFGGSGTTLTNSITVKAALVELETAVESKLSGVDAALLGNISLGTSRALSAAELAAYTAANTGSDDANRAALVDLKIKGNADLALTDATANFVSKVFSSASKVDGIVIGFASAHNFVVGDLVEFSAATGMTQLNDLPPAEITAIVNVSSYSITIASIDSTGFGTYSGSGKVHAIRKVEATAHKLVPGDAVTMPTGAGGAQEVFTVVANDDVDTAGEGETGGNTTSPNTLVAANFFYTDANPTTMPSAADGAIGQCYRDSDLFSVFNNDADNTVPKFMIDSSGNVGIGTAAPGGVANGVTNLSAGELEIRGGTVSGTGATSAGVLCISTNNQNVEDGDYIGAIVFQAPDEGTGGDAVLGTAQIHAVATGTYSGSSNDTDLVFSTATSGAVVERMRIADDGNIGIGTDAPVTALHVDATGGGEITLGTPDEDLVNGEILGSLYFRGLDNATANGAYIQAIAAGEWTTGTHTNDAPTKLNFHTQSDGVSVNGLTTPRMTILDDGNVGIGTAEPSKRLDVGVAASYTVADPILQIYADVEDDNNKTMLALNSKPGSDESAGLLFKCTSHSGGGSNVYSTIQSTSNSGSVYGGTKNLALNPSGGNVGIGEAAPSAKLEIAATDPANTVGLKITNGSGSVTSSFNLVDLIYSGDDDCSGGFFMKFSDSGGVIGNVVATNGTTATHTNSDYRIKENIVSIGGGLEKIAALNPVTFNYINRAGSHEGFIAHEVQEAGCGYSIMGNKDATKIDGDGNTVDDIQTMAITNLIPQMVSAIQELSAKVDALEAAAAK